MVLDVEMKRGLEVWGHPRQQWISAVGRVNQMWSELNLNLKLEGRKYYQHHFDGVHPQIRMSV